MLKVKQSDRVREIVRVQHVEQAKREGRSRFAVSARDVLREAEASEDFPRARTPLICTVLQSKKLLEENGLEIERIEGPPSRQSRTVVVHYVLRSEARGSLKSDPQSMEVPEESAEQWALRVTAPILGLMKEKIAQHGGTEDYLRWVREDKEGHA